MISIALAVVGGIAIGYALWHHGPAMPAKVYVEVPFVPCPTQGFGAPITKLPASIPVTIPGSLDHEIAFYGDRLGIMSVIAPKGWSCSASVGADGVGRLVVYPVGSNASSPEAVEAGETSACLFCRLQQACRLFAAATTAMSADYGESCPYKPALEVATPVRPGVMKFVDPAGVKGDGVPSGGRYVADGVMTFYLNNEDGSWLETCTLPDVMHPLCTLSLREFVALYGDD